MTDFYRECEDGIIALLRTLTTYFPNEWQVSDDDSTLMKGAVYAVIVRPGRFPTVPRSADDLLMVNWDTVTDLYVAYTNYKESWNKFKALRSDVINLLWSHPTLEDVPGVMHVEITGEEQAQYLKFSDAPDAKPNFIVQTVRITTSQLVRITGGEF